MKPHFPVIRAFGTLPGSPSSILRESHAMPGFLRRSGGQRDEKARDEYVLSSSAYALAASSPNHRQEQVMLALPLQWARVFAGMETPFRPV